MDALEAEVAILQQRVTKLENEAKTRPKVNKEEDELNLESTKLPDSVEKVEYDIVEGWKIIDLGILNKVLASAQKCGHSSLGIVEVNRKNFRNDLNSFLGLLCTKCGRQTVFPTSQFSEEEPSNFSVNKEFSALGGSAFNSLVSLVQSDKLIKKFGKTKVFKDKKADYKYFEEETNDEKELHIEEENTSDIRSSMDENSNVDSESPEKFSKSEENREKVVEIKVKNEPSEDGDRSMIEPTVCLTEEEGNDENTDNTAENTDMNVDLEGFVGMDSQSIPTIDVSTVTTNTPALALATVVPDTPVMGGSVTPHPLDQVISTNPNMFIRTTCSKILLPPGIYTYQRNNGLHSIMSVKADSGIFDDIEGHYMIIGRSNSKAKESRNAKSPNPLEQPSQQLPTHRRTSLQVFSAEVREELLKDSKINKADLDNIIIERWINLTPEVKKKYNDIALGNEPSVSHVLVTAPPTKKKKTSLNIPLPALKKFAARVAPELKAVDSSLALLENRGKLNKHILEKWVKLSEEEKEEYKKLAKSKKSEKNYDEN